MKRDINIWFFTFEKIRNCSFICHCAQKMENIGFIPIFPWGASYEAPHGKIGINQKFDVSFHFGAILNLRYVPIPSNLYHKIKTCQFSQNYTKIFIPIMPRDATYEAPHGKMGINGKCLIFWAQRHIKEQSLNFSKVKTKCWYLFLIRRDLKFKIPFAPKIIS